MTAGVCPICRRPLVNKDLALVEARHIARVMFACQGNKVQAAKLLGVARSTLDLKLARYGLPFTPGEWRTPATGGRSFAPATGGAA